MKNAADILQELTKKCLSRETIAGKMGVSTRTIDRWQRKLSKPSYAEEKLLNQIYNGYKKKES